jgi:hypothetical protein
MNNPYCPNCGRRLPCEPCYAREARAREDEYIDALARESAERTPVALLVWFTHRRRDAQWEHLNRLRAEWPYALRVLEPELPGDYVGARLAVNARDLGVNPIELEVSETRCARVGKLWVATLLEMEAEL